MTEFMGSPGASWSCDSGPHHGSGDERPFGSLRAMFLRADLDLRWITWGPDVAHATATDKKTFPDRPTCYRARPFSVSIDRVIRHSHVRPGAACWRASSALVHRPGQRSYMQSQGGLRPGSARQALIPKAPKPRRDIEVTPTSGQLGRDVGTPPPTAATPRGPSRPASRDRPPARRSGSPPPRSRPVRSRPADR